MLSLPDIGEHICQIKKKPKTRYITIIFLLVAVVIKGLMTIGYKCHKNYPVISDGYVSFEEAEVNR